MTARKPFLQNVFAGGRVVRVHEYGRTEPHPAGRGFGTPEDSSTTVVIFGAHRPTGDRAMEPT